MTTSGQRASHRISKVDIKQIRSIDISVFHITQIFLDGLWLQLEVQGGIELNSQGGDISLNENDPIKGK